MNDKNCSKKQRKIQLNLEKTKIDTEVFKVGQKLENQFVFAF